MFKSRKAKWFFLVGFSVALLVFASLSFVQAQQVKTLDKGGKKRKPPRVICVDDGVCETSEYDFGSTPENQLCADCQPEAYGNLEINQDGLQIVTTFLNKVYQHKYLGGGGVEFKETWGSNEIGSYLESTCVGDVDNDESKEIITVVNVLVREETSGKGKNRVTKRYYRQEIFIFEDGADGSEIAVYQLPEETTSGVKDSIIADVDNDGKKELVLKKGRHIEIFEIEEVVESPGEYYFTLEHVFPEYEDAIWTIDVGDADNMPGNELILAMFNVGAPIIWKYNTADHNWEETIADPIYVYGRRMDWLAIDVAKVRNVDNMPGNEIIAGGNNNRLMVWKYNKSNERYESVFISEDLGGYTQGVDAGDFDGDGENEIAIGSSFYDSTLYIFKYDGSTFQIVNSITRDGPEHGLSVGDLDGDGKDEIVSSTQGMTIFEYDGNGNLVKIYNSVFGSYLKIG